MCPAVSGAATQSVRDAEESCMRRNTPASVIRWEFVATSCECREPMCPDFATTDGTALSVREAEENCMQHNAAATFDATTCECQVNEPMCPAVSGAAIQSVRDAEESCMRRNTPASVIRWEFVATSCECREPTC